MKSKERAIFLILLVVNFAIGYYVGRPTKHELHEEFIRGAVTAISYQHIKGVAPSGFWLDSAFDFGYITTPAEFDSVNRAFAYRIAAFDTIKHDTTITRSYYKHLFIKPNVTVKIK